VEKRGRIKKLLKEKKRLDMVFFETKQGAVLKTLSKLYGGISALVTRRSKQMALLGSIVHLESKKFLSNGNGWHKKFYFAESLGAFLLLLLFVSWSCCFCLFPGISPSCCCCCLFQLIKLIVFASMGLILGCIHHWFRFIWSFIWMS